MTVIKENSWAEFTKKVAKAVSEGLPVQIRTDVPKFFVAIVDDGKDSTPKVEVKKETPKPVEKTEETPKPKPVEDVKPQTKEGSSDVND